MLEDFQYYGNIIEKYHGQGLLTLNENIRVDCEFEIAQYENGNIILICKECLHKIEGLNKGDFCFSSFKGETEDGWMINCNKGNLYPFGLSLTITVAVSQFVVEKPNSTYFKIEFVITNFIFQGEVEILKNNKQIEKISLNLEGFDEVSIIKLDNYSIIEEELKKQKYPKMTSILRIIPDSEMCITQIEQQVNDICDILSIMRGTKITWLHYTCFNHESELVGKCHANRITKNYSPFYVISPGYDGQKDTIYFIESVYLNFANIRNKFQFNTPLINVYLEAKEEKTYIATRASRLAITLGMIMEIIYYSMPERRFKRTILDKKPFSKLERKLKNAIRNQLTNDDNKEMRARLYQNIDCINRTSFFEIITDFNQILLCDFKETDIKAIVNSRNTLIHTGNFSSAKNDVNTKKRSKLLEEYFFIMHFMDKIFLKIIGYKGPYWSWEHGLPPVRTILK